MNIPPEIWRFARFCAVGVSNTLITLVTIFLCKDLLGVNAYVSNAVGYVAGLVNSFLLNRAWTFRSHGRMHTEAMRFAAGFVLCYLLQLWAVWALASTRWGVESYRIAGFAVSGYAIATVVGNVVYTLANFVYNRLVTFRKF